MTNSKNRTDSWSLQQAAWYAEQSDFRLQGLRDGAWQANNLDGYAYARAEQLRRKEGGSFWEHLYLKWGF